MLVENVKIISLYKNQEVLSRLIDEMQKKIPNDTNEIEYIVSIVELNERFDLIFKRKNKKLRGV